MILITGAAGYIGSHFALDLLKKGEKIVIFDNLSTGHIETVDKLSEIGDVTFIRGDLREYQEIFDVLKKYEIDTVVHFAAFSQVEESTKNPYKYYQNNVLGSLNLLNAMKENDVKKIVFSSTAAVYGKAQNVPIDESHPKNPINPYGKTKLYIENMMDDFDCAYGIKSVRLRYFNAAGADSSSLIGEWHENETHLIPNILKSVFEAKQKFCLFGDDYPTPDGTCVRDYINVEDLASAHYLAIKYLNNGSKSNVFNLGTNKGSSVKEVFEACEKATGEKIPLEIKPKRQGDPAILIANNKKAKELMGWIPQKSLEESILSAYRWEKKLNNFLNLKSRK